MKKIALVLIFAFVGFFSNAQMPIVKQYVVNDTLTSDTTYWIWTSTNYAWRLYVEYSINNGTTTTVIPVTKTTSTATAQEYPGIAEQTLSGTSGTLAFSDPEGHVDQYLGPYVDVQSGKTVKMNVWYYMMPISNK